MSRFNLILCYVPVPFVHTLQIVIVCSRKANISQHVILFSPKMIWNNKPSCTPHLHILHFFEIPCWNTLKKRNFLILSFLNLFYSFLASCWLSVPCPWHVRPTPSIYTRQSRTFNMVQLLYCILSSPNKQFHQEFHQKSDILLWLIPYFSNSEMLNTVNIVLSSCPFGLFDPCLHDSNTGFFFHRWIRTVCWVKSCAKEFHTGALEICNYGSGIYQLWIKSFLFDTVNQFGAFLWDLC